MKGYIYKPEDSKFPVMLVAAEPGHDDSLPDLVTPGDTSGPAEWGRYSDAVREAARTYDNPDIGDIEHFLKARAKDPGKVDAEKFHEAVRRHRMSDLVDIVDHHMRRDGSLPRGSRHIRTQAPRGYLRRAIRKMESEDLAHLHHRLTAIGHNSEDVKKYLKARAKDSSWEDAEAHGVAFADGEFAGLYFDDADSNGDEEFMERVEMIMSRVPAPVINVYINKDGEVQGESESE